MVIHLGNSSVIRQKDESQNGCFKKTKQAKFPEKRVFLSPWYAHVFAHQGVRNARFSEKLACFFFLKHPFWDSPFCLITDEFLFLMEPKINDGDDFRNYVKIARCNILFEFYIKLFPACFATILQNYYNATRMFISDGKFLYEDFHMTSLPLKENVSVPKGSFSVNYLEIHISYYWINPALSGVWRYQFFFMSVKSHMVERRNWVSW